MLSLNTLANVAKHKATFTYVCSRTDSLHARVLLIEGHENASCEKQQWMNGAAGVNRLLATLPKNEYKRLLPKLKTVSLVLGEELYEPGDVIKYVYFPNDSIISLISRTVRDVVA